MMQRPEPQSTEGQSEGVVVSIITPTKNRLKLLRETIASVSAQSFYHWEHIIVDDGSDDGTLEHVALHSLKDARVRFIQREGDIPGASVCRNIGLRKSRGEYVIFLDSDDLLASQCLERRVEVISRNLDLDFVTFKANVFEKSIGDLGREFNGDLFGDHLLQFLFLECPWQTSAPIWRKTYLDSLGGFDETLPSWQDVELHVRSLTAGAKYIRLPETDHYVRWQFESTKVSIEQRRAPRHLEAADNIIRKFEKMVREGPGMDWSRQRALCSLYFFVAENWLNTGNRSKAFRAWKQIEKRKLGGRFLHATGRLLLFCQSIRLLHRILGGKVTHKWKGWMRMRSNPELVQQ